MNRALIDYLYYFQYQHDYFECHEVMEDAWKSKDQFNKNDPEVALILYATACYHLRRRNFTGGMRCLKKAQALFSMHSTHFNQLGIITKQLQLQIQAHLTEETYQHRDIPLNKSLQLLLTQTYPNANNLQTLDDALIHKHTLRDRSDIIKMRQLRLNDKHPVHNPPD